MSFESIIGGIIGLFILSKTKEGKLVRETVQDGLKYVQRELRPEDSKES